VPELHAVSPQFVSYDIEVMLRPFRPFAWHAARRCSQSTAGAQRRDEETMHRNIQLTWIGSWGAYAVRERGRLVGLVRCRIPHLPFKRDAEFLH
jgi:hypothetical protein